MGAVNERRADMMSIGRFSETTRLSVKALRLYDEMSLLTPETVDPSNGYRYYGQAQVPRAEAIRILRAVDMPLEQIGRVLDSAPAQRNELMAEHMDRLEADLAAQRQRLAAFTDLQEGRKQLMPYEVQEKELADTNVAAVSKEVNLKSIAGAIGEGFGTIMGTIGPEGMAPTGAPFVIYHDVIDEETSGKLEMCIPVAGLFDAGGPVESKQLPGGRAASTIHKGAYDEVAGAYHAISTWMADNGYEPAAPPAEIYLNDPTEVSVSEQLTEVVWGFRPAG